VTYSIIISTKRDTHTKKKKKSTYCSVTRQDGIVVELLGRGGEPPGNRAALIEHGFGGLGEQDAGSHLAQGKVSLLFRVSTHII
jgi:hypothetical protein